MKELAQSRFSGQNPFLRIPVSPLQTEELEGETEHPGQTQRGSITLDQLYFPFHAQGSLVRFKEKMTNLRNKIKP